MNAGGLQTRGKVDESVLLIGKLHPLLVHFPIALVLAAAGAEIVAIRTGRANWRGVAVTNLRAGAAMAAVTLIAGWILATAPFVEATSFLAWHRWTAVTAVAVTIGAALASRQSDTCSRRSLVVYRGALFMAAALIAVTGHLGAALVWGTDFLKP
jgi:uncharacterized membrane protein